MKLPGILCLALLAAASSAQAEIHPGTFPPSLIRDQSTLEIRVLSDWAPLAKEPLVRQKTIEITVCEWWSGQKVRIPVSLNAPTEGGPCRNLIISSRGLSLKPSPPSGALLRLLREGDVGVVLVGVGQIDSTEPVGKLANGMKEHLLSTKDTRYTVAWFWGLSYMRALTAARLETSIFQPGKVLVTGGSKCGQAAAVAAVYDRRVTAALPVVAPMLGTPSEPFVVGTQTAEIERINQQFWSDLKAARLRDLPATAFDALAEREASFQTTRITLAQARGAGWTDAEIAEMNDLSWKPAQMARHLDEVQKRGVEIFYNVGSNDNACTTLLEMGRRFPAFPVFIVPGGQHGGPKTTGFTRQVPYLPEMDENLYAFARHHFFAARALVAAPVLRGNWDDRARTLAVTVTFPDGTEPQENELWWSVDRHPAGSLPYEYDKWKSTALRQTGPATFSAVISLPEKARTLDYLTTHAHSANGMKFSVSSPILRQEID